MDDETAEVRICLDEIIKRPDVSNKDIILAMREFMLGCHIPQMRRTQINGRRIEEIATAIAPISAWVLPKISKETKWADLRIKFLMTMLAVVVSVVGSWLMIIFSEGLRAWLLHFLIKQ